MSLNFEYLVSPVISWSWFIVAAVLAVFTLHLRRHLLPKKYQWLLLAVRSIILLFLILFLLNPFLTDVSPNNDAYKIAVFADNSASMGIKDAGKEPRFDLMKKFLNSDYFRQLSEQHQLELSVVNDNYFQSLPENVSLSTKGTQLGGSLKNYIDNQSDTMVGGLLLLSDGIDNSKKPLTETAKYFLSNDIPITSISFGRVTNLDDLSIEYSGKPVETVRGKSVDFSVKVTNKYQTGKTAEVILTDENGLAVAKRVVDLLPKSSQDVKFSVTPITPGNFAYKAKLNYTELDNRPDNDLDYIPFKVARPPFYKVLFLSAKPSLFHKFIKHSLNNQPMFQFSTLIQLGEDKLAKDGDLCLSKVKNSLPDDAAFYANFDIIIADSEIGANEKIATALNSFVSQRGGGLLTYGDPAVFHDEIKKALPVKEVVTKFESTNHYLELLPTAIFPYDKTTVLHSKPSLRIEKYHQFYVSSDLKMGARELASMTTGNRHLLAVQQYGRGRVGYLGYEDNWHWQLDKNYSSEKFRSFWQFLLTWSGAESKPRIRALFAVKKVDLNQTLNLATEVFAPDFSPAMAAEVNLKIVKPDGKTIIQPLSYSPESVAIFQDSIVPDLPGEYHATIQAKFQNGEYLEKKASFIASPLSGELQNTVSKPDLLRDVSLISHGNFYMFDDLNDFELKISKKVPVIKRKVFLFNSVVLALFMILFILLDIYLRRRIGLK